MKRILFLLPQPIYPADAGPKHHTFGLLKYLSEKYECHILGFSRKSNDAELWSSLARVLPNTTVLRTFPLQSNPRRTLNRLMNFARISPVSFALFENAALHRCLSNSFFLSQYELVHIDTFNLGFYREHFKFIPSVLVPYDAFSMGMKRALTIVKGLRSRLAYQWKWRAYSGYERQAYRYFTKVCPVSDVDAQWLQALDPAIDLETVGIPIAEEYLSNARQNYQIVEHPHIIVAGTLAIETVAIAMAEFVKQVYPVIRQALPQARVTIWGKGAPSSLLRTLRQYPEINYISYVDDYIDFLSSAALYVFPQRCGSGIQTKVQQAMAMGIPVVTRSHILFALGASAGKHAIAYDDNRLMAQAITHLAQDIEQQALLGQEGTRYIKENYRLSVVGSKLEAAYQHAVEKHRRYYSR